MTTTREEDALHLMLAVPVGGTELSSGPEPRGFTVMLSWAGQSAAARVLGNHAEPHALARFRMLKAMAGKAPATCLVGSRSLDAPGTLRPCLPAGAPCET